MSEPTFDDWTDAWPKEPGTYLFYGDLVRQTSAVFKPHLMIVEVNMVNSARGGKTPMYTATGAILFEGESSGLFKRCTIETPDWPKTSL